MDRLEIRNNLLSEDSSIVLHTAHDILHMATMDIKDRESLLDDAYHSFDKIKEHVENMSFGGSIMRNSRFVSKALLMIEQSKDDKCKCEMAFDGFGQNELMMKNYYGFILYSHEQDGYISRSIIQCPCCHTFYEVEDEYTGWHMNTFRYKKLTADDFKVKRLP